MYLVLNSIAIAFRFKGVAVDEVFRLNNTL